MKPHYIVETDIIYDGWSCAESFHTLKDAEKEYVRRCYEYGPQDVRIIQVIVGPDERKDDV